jgi:hypothetical protein
VYRPMREEGRATSNHLKTPREPPTRPRRPTVATRHTVPSSIYLPPPTRDAPVVSVSPSPPQQPAPGGHNGGTPDSRFVYWAVRSRRLHFRPNPEAQPRAARRPTLVWAVSRRAHNRLMHALNGNTNTPTSTSNTDSPPPRTEGSRNQQPATVNDEVTTPESQSSTTSIHRRLGRLRLSSSSDTPPSVTNDPGARPPRTVDTTHHSTDRNVDDGQLRDRPRLATAAGRMIASSSREPARSAPTSAAAADPMRTTIDGVHDGSTSRATDRAATTSAVQPFYDAHDGPVPSAAGGLADSCEHRRGQLRCIREVWAVCPVPWCQRGLCSTHFGLARTGRDTTQSRCHEHGASTRECPCPQCSARPPATTRDAEIPQTTITILSDDDLKRIEANRRLTLNRRAMLNEDARSRRVEAVFATIQMNRQAALQRRRLMQQATAEDRATKRPRHDTNSSLPTIPGFATLQGTPPPGWQRPMCPQPPTDFLHGRIPEVEPRDNIHAV